MIALPIGVTMMLVALWHGAAWTFLVFGVLHTAFLLVNHLWRLHRMPAAAAPVRHGVDLSLRAAGLRRLSGRRRLSGAGSVLAGMAGWHGVAFAPARRRVAGRVCWLAALYAIVWLAPSTRQIMQGESPGRLAGGRLRAGPSRMGCAATIGLLAAGGTGEFLYFRF